MTQPLFPQILPILSLKQLMCALGVQKGTVVEIRISCRVECARHVHLTQIDGLSWVPSKLMYFLLNSQFKFRIFHENLIKLNCSIAFMKIHKNKYSSISILKVRMHLCKIDMSITFVMEPPRMCFCFSASSRLQSPGTFATMR